jgi:hypothetical protein
LLHDSNLSTAIEAHTKQQKLVDELSATIQASESQLAGLKSHLEQGFADLDDLIADHVANQLKHGDPPVLSKSLDDAKRRREHTIASIGMIENGLRKLRVERASHDNIVLSQRAGAEADAIIAAAAHEIATRLRAADALAVELRMRLNAIGKVVPLDTDTETLLKSQPQQFPMRNTDGWHRGQKYSAMVASWRAHLSHDASARIAEQIDSRAAALGAARGMAEADPAELAAVQKLLAELDAKAKSAAPGSKEQERALAQSHNVERELLRLQGQLPGDDSEAELEAKKADWAQAFEATLSEALDGAASYSDRLKIRAEFSRLAHAHDERQDDDKGRFRTREPDRGRTR